MPNRQGLDGLTLEQVMRRFRVPGVSVAVIKDFQIHWAKGYGVADVDSGRAVQIDTPFQAASISKPVTAMAAMRLVQDGTFVARRRREHASEDRGRCPRATFTKAQPVTPRSLMSHTSGADDGFGFPGYEPAAPRPSVVQILDGQPPSNVGRVTFARAPYAAYKYSGGGVTLMQLLLTDLTGEPFAALMRTRVLDPLGMTSSTFEQPPPTRWTARLSPRAQRPGRARQRRRGTSIPSRPRPGCGRPRATSPASPSRCSRPCAGRRGRSCRRRRRAR